jgi:hypothetical protein
MQENEMPHEAPEYSEVKQAAIKAAADIGSEIQESGQRVLNEVRDAGTEFAAERKNDAVGYLKDLVDAARKGTKELDSRGHSRTASVAGRALQSFDDATERLADRSPEDLLHDLNDFARARPVALFSAAFLVGFGATRFLKSSRNEEQPDATEMEDAAADAHAAPRNRRNAGSTASKAVK